MRAQMVAKRPVGLIRLAADIIERTAFADQAEKGKAGEVGMPAQEIMQLIELSGS